MRSPSGFPRLFALVFTVLILLGFHRAVSAADLIFLDSFEAAGQCVDLDSDGWTICQNDCCDTQGQCGPDSGLVNPGAFDFAANTIDDDCDGTVDNPVAACDGALASNSSEPLDYARAMELCSFTVESPPITQKTWGVIDGGLFLASGAGTPAANSRSIRPGFGAGVAPLAGSRIAVLSTGHAAAPGNANPAFAAFQGGQRMGTMSAVPSDWLAANAGTMPATPGCPSSQGGNTAVDPVLLKLRVRVPTNARSFSARAYLFSSEYPEYVCAPCNDYFLTLLDSQFAPVSGETANPLDKNLAFYDPPPAGAPFHPISGNLAVGDTGLFTQCKNGPIGCATGGGAIPSTTSACTGTAQLAGTGFDTANPQPQFANDPGFCGTNNLLGGGTGWLTLRGNVVRGETMELRFVVWDSCDGYYDTVVLFDDFRWSMTPTTPGTSP